MRKPFLLAGLVIGWSASRAALVWLLLGQQEWVTGDTAYYARSLRSFDEVGPAGTLVEYPLPAVAVVALPWLLARGLGMEYAHVLVAVVVLTDLVFTLLVARHDRCAWGTLGWLLAVPLLGTTAYARFDLLPGVLCGVAVLTLAGRPRVAAGCAAVATAVKLWPVLVLPAVLAGARPRRPALLLVAAVGTAAVLAVVVAAGWERLLSPLGYQADRGLQIESVPATPVMLAWAFAGDAWTVWFAPSHSYEITGPGVEALLLASAACTLAYVVLLGLGWWRLWRARDVVTRRTVVWSALAAVTGFLVVGKVLSPQYLLWLLPMAMAAVAVTGDVALRRWAAGLLLAAGLTHVVFPATYEALTFPTDRAWLTVLVLALRNVLMVGLLAVAGVRAWAGLRGDSQRGKALDRQPPGPDGNGVRTRR